MRRNKASPRKEALKKGLDEKSKEFVEHGTELYHPV